MREVYLSAKTNYTVKAILKLCYHQFCKIYSFSNYISASRILAQLLGIINVGALFACVVVPMVMVSHLSSIDIYLRDIFQFDLDNTRIDDCVDRLYGNINTTSEKSLCDDRMGPNITYMHQMLKNISIVYGNEDATEKACDMDETTHFPEV